MLSILTDICNEIVWSDRNGDDVSVIVTDLKIGLIFCDILDDMGISTPRNIDAFRREFKHILKVATGTDEVDVTNQ